jgi:hypothetical protein
MLLVFALVAFLVCAFRLSRRKAMRELLQSRAEAEALANSSP